MHRSALSTFVIDCPGDLAAATAFWSAALGRDALPPEPGDDRYRTLAAAPSEPLLMVQRVDHAGRVHLDIESDDIPAEVARLEALGARRVEAVRTWVVMEAPTGQRFCVVRPQRGELGLLPRTAWPSAPVAPYAGGPEHDALRALVGRYVGHTKTWLDPTAPPDETIAELEVSPLAGGRWLRFDHHGRVGSVVHHGELLLGYHRDAAAFEACWVDSFHTGSAMMLSSGKPRPDAVIEVLGSYQADGETWRWRTTIEPAAAPGAGFTMRATNIAPSGDESPAIETRWSPPR